MRRYWTKITGLTAFSFLLLQEVVFAAGEKAAPLVVVADTRKFSGWMAQWTDLYNESHLYFALVTVVLIPVIGFLFGVLADLVMGHIGLDLKSRELAEH